MSLWLPWSNNTCQEAPFNGSRTLQRQMAFNVGLIIGSQRVVRIGPQVASFVQNTIQNATQDRAAIQEGRVTTNITIVDLADQKLPLFDEPGIPQQIRSPEDYVHEHTRAWARRIATLDGFVFVSAQRNWGIPAELKNAIDYLFHEWRGKPAMIVTYGGHGGGQCSEQLRTVLGSIGMRIKEQTVNMSFPSPDFRVKAFRGEDLGLDAGDSSGPWSEHQSEIVRLWDNLINDMSQLRCERSME